MREKFRQIWALALVLILVTGVCFLFSSRKQGMFIDEIYTYGLSNSSYRPFLGGLKYDSIERRVVTRDELLDYVTVSGDEGFDFASVYYNQVNDVHPPLYYWLFNIASTLARGSFSKWTGLVLDWVIYLGCVWMLYALVRKLGGSRLNAAAGAAVGPALSDAAIAAFSVVSKIMMLFFSALLGFGQAFQPVCGFNYGAGKYGRVQEAYRFCLKVAMGFLAVVSCFGFAFAPRLIALFRDDPNVIAIGSVAMRCQCCSFTLMGLVVTTNMLYQNIGRVVGATLLAVARQGLMFIPVVLILPHVFTPPIWGVYLAQPTADLFAFCLALPLAVRL